MNVNRLEIVLIAVSVVFISLVMRAPFSIGLLIGAAIMAIYGWQTKQNDLLAAAAFVPGFGLLAWWANWLVYLITPHTIDSSLLRIDVGIGIAVWHWTLTHPALVEMLSVVYYGLGVAAGFSICSSSRRSELFRSCIIAAVFAPLLYIVFPACGPAHMGHAAARNCIPSLHFSWALLLYLYCSSRLKPVMLAFVLLTGWATMGLGEHYFIDLVVAVLFTFAVCKLAKRITPVRYQSSSRESSSVGSTAEGLG